MVESVPGANTMATSHIVGFAFLCGLCAFSVVSVFRFWVSGYCREAASASIRCSPLRTPARKSETFVDSLGAWLFSS